MPLTKTEKLLTRPFTAAQAQAAGLSRHRLQALRREGAITTILYGVYAAAELRDSVDLRVAAVKLAMPPHTIVCDRTAAWLHGVDAFDFAELEWLPPVDVCVLPAKNRSRRDECKGSRRDLATEDVMDLVGVQVTTPLRTALDLGCNLSRPAALATLDAFLHAGYFNAVALHNEVRRFRRRRGVVQLRQLIRIVDPKAESPGESWTRLAILDAGLPAPDSQYVVVVNGAELFRLDLAYWRHRICVEYDGVQFHDTPEARAYDEMRRRWLREHGWTVIVVRKDDFTPEAMVRWTSELRAALESRHYHSSRRRR